MPNEGSARERTALVTGMPVRYWVAGAGEPVVLIHGLSGSSRWWVRNIAALAEHFRVYVVDLPGFGGARRLAGRIAFSELSVWLHAWMEVVGLESASLVGHSMGGAIALELAARWPEVVRRLVLAAPAGVPYRATVRGYARPLLAEVRTLDPYFATILLHDALRAGPKTILRAAVELIGQDIRMHAPAVRAPTLLIWGARDALVPPAAGAVLADLLPQSDVLILSPAGHVVMFDASQTFNAAVTHFLLQAT